MLVENTSTLKNLLGSIDVHDFINHYWEKSPLRVQYNSDKPYQSILTIEDVDRILSTNRFAPHELRMAQHDSIIIRHQYCSDLNGHCEVDISKVLDLYSKGASIILNSLHKVWPSLKSLCSTLEIELLSSVQVNVYLTPPSSQGFSHHYDTHDVFILQLEGLKRWNIYGSPIPLPLKTQPHDSDTHNRGPIQDNFLLKETIPIVCISREDIFMRLNLHICLRFMQLLVLFLLSGYS